MPKVAFDRTEVGEPIKPGDRILLVVVLSPDGKCRLKIRESLSRGLNLSEIDLLASQLREALILSYEKPHEVEGGRNDA